MNALQVMLRLGFNAYAKNVFMFIQVRIVLQMFYKQDIQTGTTSYTRNNQSTKHLVIDYNNMVIDYNASGLKNSKFQNIGNRLHISGNRLSRYWFFTINTLVIDYTTS